MNKKIYLWFGIVITILISYGIALIAFVLDNTDAIKWGEILSDGTTFASRLSVPVVLAIWSHNKSISDKIELKRKEDREIILSYVKKYLEPLVYKPDQKEDKNEEELKDLLNQFSVWFSYLQASIRYLSYSYMYEYFELLSMYTVKIAKSKHLSIEELNYFYAGFSTCIYLIPSFLQSDENQYYKDVLRTVEFFIEDEDVVRKATLEVLEKDFPEYYEYALKYIEEEEQQQQQAK